MSIIHDTITAHRFRAPTAFDVEYFQGATARWRLVYAVDEHAAALSVIRSTWNTVRIRQVTPIASRLRQKPAADWSAG